MARTTDIALRFGSEGVVRACGLASFPLLARELGADGYGVVLGAGIFAGLGLAIAGMGLSFHVGRLLAAGDGGSTATLLRSLVLATTVAGALIAILLGAFSGMLAPAFLGHDEGVGALLAVTIGILAGSSDGVLLEWLRARTRFRTIAAMQTSTALVQLAAILAGLALGGGPAAIVAAISSVQLLKCLATLVLLRGMGEFASPNCQVLLPRSQILDLISTASPVWVATLLAWGMASLSRLVLGLQVDASALGAFGAAALIASVIGMVGSACWLPLYPALTRCVAHQRPGSAAIASSVYGRWFHLAAVPATAIGAVLGGPAMACLAGAGFPDVSVPCAILLISAYVEMSALPWSYVLSAHGDAKQTRNGLLLGCLVSAFLSVPLTASAGLAGASAALLGGQLATAAWNHSKAAGAGHKPWRHLPWRTLAVATIATIPAIGIAYVAQPVGWGPVLATAALAGLAYLSVLALLLRCERRGA